MDIFKLLPATADDASGRLSTFDDVETAQLVIRPIVSKTYYVLLRQ